MFYCSNCWADADAVQRNCTNCGRPLTQSSSSRSSGGNSGSVAPQMALAISRRTTPSSSLPSVSFAVNDLSLQNDLGTHSSDDRRRNIATKVNLGFGTDDYQIHYAFNPTATSLGSAVLPPDVRNPEHRLAERFAFPANNEEVMYVVTRDGRFVLGTRPHHVRRPHPTLVEEPDPEILTGGTITMRAGLIYEVRDDSGHHQPTYLGVEALLRAFSQVPRSLFHPDFQGFKPFQATPIRPDFTQPTTRNIRIGLQRSLTERANAIIQRLQTRTQSDLQITSRAQTQNNVNALGTAIQRQDALFPDLEQVLQDMSYFAVEYGAEVNPQLANQGARQAQALYGELRVQEIPEPTDANALKRTILERYALFNRIAGFLGAFVILPAQ